MTYYTTQQSVLDVTSVPFFTLAESSCEVFLYCLDYIKANIPTKMFSLTKKTRSFRSLLHNIHNRNNSACFCPPTHLPFYTVTLIQHLNAIISRIFILGLLFSFSCFNTYTLVDRLPSIKFSTTIKSVDHFHL